MKKDVKKLSKGLEKKTDDKIKINFEELIFSNLSAFKLTYDLAGYQYTELDLSNKNLEGLSNTFNNYKYLETIDLSQNNIIDFNMRNYLIHNFIKVANLPFLIKLNMEGNSVKDLKPFANEENFKSLRVFRDITYNKFQFMNLSKNKIVDLGPIKIASLVSLNLNDNRIEKFETFDGHPKLRILELRRNKVGALTIFNNLPEMRELYLAENKVKLIQGIETMPNLQILHLRKNLVNKQLIQYFKIEGFDETFPAMENLQYLNFRENKIEKYDEILKLNQLPQLKTLIFSNNNVTIKNANYLLDTVNNFLKLNRLNKIYITKNLKLKAFKFSEEKWKKEQEAKAQAEADERAKEAALNQQQEQ